MFICWRLGYLYLFELFYDVNQMLRLYQVVWDMIVLLASSLWICKKQGLL
jgi:hypothetical protein